MSQDRLQVKLVQVK